MRHVCADFRALEQVRVDFRSFPGEKREIGFESRVSVNTQMLNESQGSVTPMHRGHTVKPNLTSELLNQAEINLRRAEIGSTFLHRLDCLRTKTIVEYKTNY